MMQSIWETGHFEDPLFVHHNDCFGIKYYKEIANDNETPVLIDTHEYKNGKKVPDTCEFSHFDSIQNCIKKYAGILNKRLNTMTPLLKQVLK